MAIKKTYIIKDDSLKSLPNGSATYVLVQTSKEGSTTVDTTEVTVSVSIVDVQTILPA